MARTDADLFEHAKAGDANALQVLVERYLPQLHAFVRLRLSPDLRARESTMDIVQSVCRGVLGQHGAFAFHGEARFRAWLFTTALNKLREKIRHHHYGKRDVGKEEGPHDDGLYRAATYLSPSMDAIGKETAAALEASLDALSEEHREVITMARVAKLPHNVIAEVMGRSEEAVRQLLARALLKLSQELRGRGVELD